MADAFFDNLGIIDQTNGDNASTWGDKQDLNNQYFKDAIVGVATADVSAGDATLSSATSSTSTSVYEARKARINIIGALTAARNVIVPAKIKIYLVSNNTTNAYAVTVKTPSGTGIVVPQGSVMLLFCDGTNVLEGLTAVNNFVAAVNHNDTTLSRANLKDFALVSQTIATSGATQTIDLTAGNAISMTLTANTAITFSNPSPTGNLCMIWLRLIQDGTGGWNPTYTNSIRWLGTSSQGSAPIMPTDIGFTQDVLLATNNAGTGYVGYYLGFGNTGASGSPAPGAYLIVGENHSCSYSSDGINWSARDMSGFTSNSILDVVYASSKFHLLANENAPPISSILKSSDGLVFTSPSGGTNFPPYKIITFTNGNIIEMGVATNAYNLSTDGGATFTAIGTSGNLEKVCNSGNEAMWISNGSFGGRFITTTSDGGSTLSVDNSTYTGSTNSVVCGLIANGNYLIGGSEGAIGYKSTLTGTIFTAATSNLTAAINQMIWTGTKYVAVCDGGKIANTASLGTWTTRTSNVNNHNIIGIVNNGGVLTILTNFGDMAYSIDDGDTWVAITGGNNPINGSMRGIGVFLGRTWVWGDKLASSADGKLFTLVQNPAFGTNAIIAMAAH